MASVKPILSSNIPHNSPPTNFRANSINSIGTSPTHSFIPSSITEVRQSKALHPLDHAELRLLLLENISQDAVKSFKDMGFQVDFHTKAWSEEELLANIGNYHAIGIRSKTKVTKNVLKAASKVSWGVTVT